MINFGIDKLDSEKSVVLEIIDFHLQPYFDLKREGVSVLKALYKDSVSVKKIAPKVETPEDQECRERTEHEIELREAEEEQLEKEERQAEL